MSKYLLIVQRCFKEDKVFYSTHAREEMHSEEFGVITEIEVSEVVENGEIIEEYEDDQPYPSALLYGKTTKDRPLHIVFAYSEKDDLVIIITVYQPDPLKWVDYRRRRK